MHTTCKTCTTIITIIALDKSSDSKKTQKQKEKRREESKMLNVELLAAVLPNATNYTLRYTLCCLPSFLNTVKCVLSL